MKKLLLRYLIMSISLLGIVCNSACSVVAESASITSFQECVAAGNKVLRTFPARCVTSDGLSFVETGGVNALPLLEAPVSKKLCVDQCGNGSCDMIVCMGEGCPCAENSQRCPKDCAQ